MYFNESIHFGRPHFHAFYGEHYASFDIDELTRLSGELPPGAERLVRQWARARRTDLLRNWESARRDGTLKPIDPLK